ncbi:MAG: hypothetical protein Q9195_004187 [Heterodermia aff. obscurata]
MADPFSTVAAVVSFADVTIRACKVIYEVVGSWKDAPNAIQRLRQTLQNLESMLGSLRRYVVEYESSKLFLEQHQLLPEVVKNELPEIDLEIQFLKGCLSPVGTQRNIRQRIRRIIDEKKILAVVSRLNSRQAIITTSLQILAQRNAIQLYEQASSIRNDLRQNDVATSSQIQIATSSINQRLHDIARVESDAIAAQKTTLDSVHTLLEPITDNHATIMNKLNDLLTVMKGNEGHLRTNTLLQATSKDDILRMVRAELRMVVIPSMEEYLNAYKSSHNTQLERIRRDLDQMVSALGHLSVVDLAAKKNKGNQESATGLQDSEFRDDVFYHQRPPTENMNQLPQVFRRANLNDDHVVQAWSHSWRQTWIFRWRIGVLMVHITASYCQSPVRQQEFQAFKHCRAPMTRYSYHVSVYFQPAPNLLIARGIFIRCKSQQDQRGSYEISPRLATFAIVPYDAEVFKFVRNRDLAGLRVLFETGLAAPTDRTEDSLSLLHVSEFYCVEI